MQQFESGRKRDFFLASKQAWGFIEFQAFFGEFLYHVGKFFKQKTWLTMFVLLAKTACFFLALSSVPFAASALLVNCPNDTCTPERCGKQCVQGMKTRNRKENNCDDWFSTFSFPSLQLLRSLGHLQGPGQGVQAATEVMSKEGDLVWQFHRVETCRRVLDCLCHNDGSAPKINMMVYTHT